MRNANEEMTNDILTLGPKSQNSYLFIFLKISHYSFLTSHYSFLTSHYSFLISHFSFGISFIVR